MASWLKYDALNQSAKYTTKMAESSFHLNSLGETDSSNKYSIAMIY